MERDGRGSKGSPGGVVDCDGLGDALGLLDFEGLALLWALGLLEAVLVAVLVALPPLVLRVVLCWLLPGAVVPPVAPPGWAVADGTATDPGRVEAGRDVGE